MRGIRAGLSDREHDSAEGAALNQVTQSIRRFRQREGLGHDWFDRAGLKQRDDGIPGLSPGRRRLNEQYEALELARCQTRLVTSMVALRPAA